MKENLKRLHLKVMINMTSCFEILIVFQKYQFSPSNGIFGGQFVSLYFQKAHLMRSTLVDFYLCKNQSLFL